MTRRVLTSLRLDKIAAVDQPCQEHASADIMKRDFSADERREAAASGDALPDGSFPIKTVGDLENAVRAVGRADDQAKARAHIITRAKALGATSQLPDGWVLKADPGTPIEEDTMSKELAKALGLPETATEADITKAASEKVARVAELEKAAAKADAIAKMSDKHTAYMNHPDATLPKGGKDAFAEMSPPERDDHIKANPCEDDEDGIAKALKSGDAFKTPAGVVITKRKVGPELFDVLKGQNDLLVSQGADLAKAKETAAVTEFAKRATDLGFDADFGATMRKAYGGDAVAQAEVEKRILALQKQVETGDVFKNFGSNAPQAGSAEAELLAKVDEVKKGNPTLKAAQAYAKAYTDPSNADIVKRMKAEAAA